MAAAVVAFVVAAVLVWFGFRAVRDPRFRRRATRKFERGWTQVEDAAGQFRRRVARRRARAEVQTQRLLAGLWELVDDLPFVSAAAPFPAVPPRLYGHGAFFGAAPALMADPTWKRILAFLMPDVYRDVVAAVTGGRSPAELIPMFENNPVMCAFGVAQARGGHADDLVGMEWDVFLDSALADQFAETDGAADDGAEAAREALVARIVDSLVIAHASTTDTVQEQIGLCQFRDVRKTRKAKLGGVEHRAWLDLFARALRLASSPDVGVAIREMGREPRVDTDEECRRFTFASPMSVHDAVDVYRAFTGRPRFSVVLEIKSLRSTAALLAAMVGELNRRGVHVAAVGSFVLKEIAGVGAIAQQVADRAGATERLPGPREILFMHFAGDLQAACDAGAIPVGSSAMFNGASLLGAPTRTGAGAAYDVKSDVIDDLAAYRDRFELALGLYVQENDTDVDAAAQLSAIVRDNPNLFSLGFAWGGLGDQAAIGGGVGDHRGFGGQRYLDRLGVARHWVVRRAE